MNRRELVRRVFAGSTVLVLAPSVLNSCTKSYSTDTGSVVTPTRIDLDLSSSLNSALDNPGGWLIVQNIIVINSGGGNYSALSSICTHQGCTVAYSSGSGNIQCPCHGSVYSTSGSVIQGPAQRALQAFPVSVNNNILSISR
jgi:cytochrome b6-f complex iron-sulfur subunit